MSNTNNGISGHYEPTGQRLVELDDDFENDQLKNVEISESLNSNKSWKQNMCNQLLSTMENQDTVPEYNQPDVHLQVNKSTTGGYAWQNQLSDLLGPMDKQF